jgi:DNA modification methylase
MFPDNVKVIDQLVSDRFAAYHGDSCEVMKGLPDNSIHFSIYSPPFADLFTYSASERDLGNSKGDTEFMFHFRYIVRELYRVLMPGRLMAVHCMPLGYMKYKDGYVGIKDFPGKLIRIFERAGFIMHQPNITIWRDPVIERARSNVNRLLHSQIIADKAKCGVGTPDYLVVMRKPGENTQPIEHCFQRYVGEMPEPQATYTTDDDPYNRYSIEVWQRYASPVWFDIDRGDTLNDQGSQEIDREKHICPLQLGVIRRALHIWTNPGDIVIDPFSGIGSTGVVSLQEGRRAVLCELKRSYYSRGLTNLLDADQVQASPNFLHLVEA